MAQGRYRQGRYQQGIGIPETLGVQPTTWTEPKSPELKRTTWTSPNAGVSRNYGSTPGYVDTLPHRWTYASSGDILNQLAGSYARGKTRSATSGSTPSSSGGFSMPPSGSPATGANVPSAPPTYSAPTGVGMAVPPPPSNLRRASKLEPMETPPMSEQGSDFLTASMRTASDEPFTPNVEWRDEPENPFPVGTRREFDARRMFDPDYLPVKERSISPAKSRTQNRKPKNI